MSILLTLALVAPQSPMVKHLSEGPQAGAPAGVALAATPDWDGDGVDDYVVGIPDYEVTSPFGGQMPEAGLVEIRSGADGSVLAAASEPIFSVTDPARLGQSVAGGFVTDLTSAAVFPMAGVPGRGQVRVISINPFGGIVTGTTVASALDSSSFIDESFGAVIANIGDITGDGRPELAVGSPLGDRVFQNPFGSPLITPDVGRVRVFEGGTYAEIGRWSTFAVTGARFGSAIIPIADITGDGFNELVVGAPGDGAGRVYVIDPTVSEAAGILAELTGTNAGDEFGAALASLGDLDGGGRDELLIGAPGRSVGLTFPVRTGSVEAWDGESYTQLWTKNGSLFGYVGETVAAADLDGDGFKSALLIDGLTVFDEPDRVRAYDGLTGVEETSFEAWPAASGAALAAGLDVDGDGGEDFLVGLPELNDGAGGQLCYGLYLGSGGGTGSASRWLVDDDGPADFSSLAVAALVVNPGDTIEVMPGSYAGTTITKPLIVMGLGDALVDPVVVDRVTVDGASRVTLTGLVTTELTVRDVPGRAALGNLVVDGATTTIDGCADVTLARSDLTAIADPTSGFDGPAGLSVNASSLQLVASTVRGADGPDYSNDGGDGVVLTGGSKLWSTGSTLIGGDGDHGVPEFYSPGGDGGDALVVNAGCAADVRGRTVEDQLIGGADGIATAAVDPSPGYEVRTLGNGTARLASTMSGGVTGTGTGITWEPYSTPWLDYDPVASLGWFFEMRVFTEPAELALFLTSLGPANLTVPNVLGTPLWTDLATLGQLIPVTLTSGSNPETGYGQAYPVPTDVQFIGLQFHVQALVYDATTDTYEGTNGGAVTVGL